jgi:hypothetical protein
MRALPVPMLASLIASTLLLSLAGCAAPRPQAAPPLTPSAAVTPRFAVPSVRERMLFLAQQEWAVFGRPDVRENGDGSSQLSFPDGAAATYELQGPMLTRVMMYWYAVSRLPVVGHDGELRPWSAAFVAWLARAAGLTPDQFPATVLHWDYIERFIVPRDDDRFATRDPSRYAPRVGDLVCNHRDGASPPSPGSPSTGSPSPEAPSAGSPSPEAPSAGSLPAGSPLTPAPAEPAPLRRGPYHCDLVVGVSQSAVEAIGGNVHDVVARIRLPVDADGLLQPHPTRRWAAVLEQRAP